MISLYKILEDCHYPYLVLSPSTLEKLVTSVIELMIEQQLVATLWVKPATSWIAQIETYISKGNLEKVYWCQTFTGGNVPQPEKSKVVPLELDTSADLKKEFFFCVMSPEFSLLILAQQQPVSTMSTKLTRRQSVLQLKVFCTVDTEYLEKVFQGIKQIVSPVDNSISLEFLIPKQNNTNANLLMKLLLKHIEATERLTEEATTIGNSKRGSTVNQSILLQEQFIDQLSRELRPPLTNMKTAICLLESKYIKPSQRELYLKLLHKEWDKQNNLLTGLLELVNLEHLSSQEQTPIADIKEILPGIISTYQPLAKEKDIQLNYKISPNLPAVSCSPLWLKQIILNILSNNLKFTNSPGKVFVEASVTTRGVELCFTDTGIGINSNELPKIFDSFYRGRNYLGEENQGAGLGLTIVKELLDRCEGSILVNSQVNKGSVFRVIFKIVPE